MKTILLPLALWTLSVSFLQAQSNRFDITAFGAKPDSTTLCTQAIQDAINRCAGAGGGTVWVPAGVFLTGSIRLLTGVDLYLAPGATLLGSSSRSDYSKNRWYALVLADGQSNIRISGEGTIRGNGYALSKDVIRRWKAGELEGERGWDEKLLEKNRPSEKNRPEIIDFQRCKKVVIQGVHLRDGACWIQTYEKCEDLLIDNIEVKSTSYWNNDGIDLVDCHRVVVRNCLINTGDDGICLKSHDPAWRCEDILIQNCRIRSSASALKFGTASLGGFHHIRVRGLTIWDTFRSAIALESVDGGILDDVDIRDVTAKNTGNAIFIRLGQRNLKRPPGKVENIRIRNVWVEIPAGKPDRGYETEGPPPLDVQNTGPGIVISGIPEHLIRNVRLKNIEVTVATNLEGNKALAAAGDHADPPERPSDYPEFSMFGELPAWGLFARHAADLRLTNCRFTLNGKDYREVMVSRDAPQFQSKRTKVRNGKQPSPTSGQKSSRI
jgi:polygalacturonase